MYHTWCILRGGGGSFALSAGSRRSCARMGRGSPGSPSARTGRMKELVLAKQAEYGYTVIEIEVLPDHVHLLLDVDPRAGINVVVGKIKGFTSHELRNEFPHLKKRLPTLWTRSKFISTVGAVTLDVVQQYIESQKGV